MLVDQDEALRWFSWACIKRERFQVAYVWMTSSGDGHRVRGVQVQDEKPKVICFEACGPHHDNVHVKMGLS